jgi:hypothetical protein
MAAATIVRVLDELFVARFKRRMSLLRVSTYLALIVLMTLVPMRGALAGPSEMSDDGHAKQSLNLAVGRAFCRQPSALSRDIQLHEVLDGQHGIADVPIIDIIARRWGSVERYCATATAPAVNNENSLMLTEAWLLRLMPRSSLREIGFGLLALQISMFSVLCFALLRAGAGVLLCAAVFQVAVDVLSKVRAGNELAAYPFMACVIALLVGVYMQSLVSGGARLVMLASAVCGVITAYAANMRTSYVPMFAAFFVIWVVGVIVSRTAKVHRRRGAVTACLLFVAGYAVFHFSLLPHVREVGGNSYSNHVIAHPLVLSLAVPDNPLAVREGIKWNDSVGLTLARRVDPSVEDMRPGYESALFRYYFGLWRRYPGDMFGIYFNKWRIAGASVLASASRGDWNWTTRTVMAAPRRLTNGFEFLGVLLVTVIVTFVGYLRVRAPLLMGACLMAVAGLWLLAETAIIMPAYAVKYHQSLLLVVAVLTLLGAQGVVSLLVAQMEPAIDRHRAIAPGDVRIDPTGERTNGRR